MSDLEQDSDIEYIPTKSTIKSISSKSISKRLIYDQIARQLNLQIVSRVSSGRHGVVWKVQHLENKTEYALKISFNVFSSSYDLKDYLSDMRRFFLINQYPQFFVHFHKWGTFKQNESSDGGVLTSFPDTALTENSKPIKTDYSWELMELLHPQKIEESQETVQTLFEFLSDFWRAGWIHGDLSTDNIILTTKGWKLIDVETVIRNSDADQDPINSAQCLRNFANFIKCCKKEIGPKDKVRYFAGQRDCHAFSWIKQKLIDIPSKRREIRAKKSIQKRSIEET